MQPLKRRSRHLGASAPQIVLDQTVVELIGLLGQLTNVYLASGAAIASW